MPSEQEKLQILKAIAARYELIEKIENRELRLKHYNALCEFIELVNNDKIAVELFLNRTLNMIKTKQEKKNVVADEIGRHIRDARKSIGLNQTVFADKLGTIQNQVARWETGKYETPPSMLIKIAALTKKPISYFFGNEKQGTNYIQQSSPTVLVKEVPGQYNILEDSIMKINKRLDTIEREFSEYRKNYKK